jgi:hypothetical protein
MYSIGYYIYVYMYSIGQPYKRELRKKGALPGTRPKATTQVKAASLEPASQPSFPKVIVLKPCCATRQYGHLVAALQHTTIYNTL